MRSYLTYLIDPGPRSKELGTDNIIDDSVASFIRKRIPSSDREEGESLLPDSQPNFEGGTVRVHTTASTFKITRKYTKHSPIPATTVFARNAPILYLPSLDKYIASLPPPSFSLPEAGDNEGNNRMFPPMDILEASGKTLEDFERNRTVSPQWRRSTTILGKLVDIFLGITVRQMLYHL